MDPTSPPLSTASTCIHPPSPFTYHKLHPSPPASLYPPQPPSIQLHEALGWLGQKSKQTPCRNSTRELGSAARYVLGLWSHFFSFLTSAIMAWQLYNGWNGSRDGNWSTFNLRIGTPPQVLPALVSASNSWVSLPFAESPPCLSDIPGESFDCSHHLHRSQLPLYQPCESTTSQNAARCEIFSDIFDDGSPELHEMVLNETRLMNGSIVGHGLDPDLTHKYTASLGMMFRLHKHGIEESFVESIYSHGSPDADRADSFIQSFPHFYLSEKYRPLYLGYGYTAGAWYRDYPASLSIGSTDPSRVGSQSRIIPIVWTGYVPEQGGLSRRTNDMLQLDFKIFNASDTLRKAGEIARPNYLDTEKEGNFATVIDPNYPYLQLPEGACYRIAQDFELDFIQSNGMFSVSNSTRARLRQIRPFFTLRVGYARDGVHVPPIDITLPYEAFEHDYTLPSGEIVPYFPIRIAPKTKQGTTVVLGRVFFQEVYIAVDYHNRSYNLSTAAFPYPGPAYSDRNLIFHDRPYRNYSALPPYGYTGTWRFQWLVYIIKWASLVLLILFFIHGVLPWLFALPKYWALRHRRKKREQLWIDLHAEGWSNLVGMRTHPRRSTRHRAQTSQSSSALGTVKASPRVLGTVGVWVLERMSRLLPRKYQPWASRHENTGNAVDMDADLIVLENEFEIEAERRRREEEERLKRQTDAREARKRAWESGKKFGNASTEFLRHRVLPVIIKPFNFAFTWSPFPANWKEERDRRRRAARLLERQGTSLLDR